MDSKFVIIVLMFSTVGLITLWAVVHVGVVEGANSTKKGVAVSYKNYLCGDMEAFSYMNWWSVLKILVTYIIILFHYNCILLPIVICVNSIRYDWRLYSDYVADKGCSSQPPYNRVPMVWGYRSGKNLSGLIPEGTEYVLGFNEPNHSPQSNLTPQQAVEGWREIERVAGYRKLISPAAAPCGAGPPKCLNNTIEWFDEFFRLCTGCRVDFLATHKYSGNPQGTLHFLESLYNRYGLRIWLTEFSRPNTGDEDAILAYMQGVLPLLEAADFVYKYSWFVQRRVDDKFVHRETSLLEQDSPTLTTLGQFYNNYQPWRGITIGPELYPLKSEYNKCT